MDYLKDEIRVDEAIQEPTANPAFSLSSVSLWIQNIMVLKYISDVCGNRYLSQYVFLHGTKLVLKMNLLRNG